RTFERASNDKIMATPIVLRTSVGVVIVESCPKCFMAPEGRVGTSWPRRLLDRLRQMATKFGCESAQRRDDDLRVAPRGRAGTDQACLAVFQELVGARSGEPPRGDKHASPLGIDIELFDSDQH